MVANLPRLKVYVSKYYLTKKIEDLTQYESAYLVSIHANINNPFLFTVHLESGALFSGLPIAALNTLGKSTSRTLGFYLNYWGSICDSFQVLEVAYLKEYEVLIRGEAVGKYLFSIEPLSGGYAEDPEQYKFLHCIAIDSGEIGIFPNNDLRFIDRHFTNEDLPTDHYRRNVEKYAAW